MFILFNPDLPQWAFLVVLPDSHLRQHTGVLRRICAGQNDSYLGKKRGNGSSFMRFPQHVEGSNGLAFGYRLRARATRYLFHQESRPGSRWSVCRVWTLHVVPELGESQRVRHLQLILAGEHAAQQLELGELSLCPLQVGHADDGERPVDVATI